MNLLIEDYLSANISGFRLKENGEATGGCPFCGKPKDHFYIHLGGERNGLWTCFSCQQSGNFWSIVGEVEGISSVKAKAWWIENEIDFDNHSDLTELKTRLLALQSNKSNKDKVKYGLPMGFKRIKRRRPKMLADRGIALETARYYGLGYCKEGEIAGRIVFPIRCPLGDSWTARSVTDAKPKYWAGEGAGKLLYGWNEAFRNGTPKRLIVCEGPVDVLSLYQAGLKAVAVMQKSINERRAKLLRNCGSELIVMLDSEAVKEALEVSLILGGVKVAFLDRGDPGESSPKVLRSAVRNALNAIDANCLVSRNKINKLKALKRTL